MERRKKQQIVEGWDFNIELEPEGFEKKSEYWEKQCNILYGMILKELPSGSIQPLHSESAKDEKTDFITIFSTLVALGITTKAFDKIFDVLKIWLENRPKTKVTLKYSDGSTIEITDLPKSEALAIMETHQKELRISNKM